MGIFADHAPAYWAKNIPVIPLVPQQKRPAPQGWQVYAERMPTADEQAAWIRSSSSRSSLRCPC